MPLGIIVVSFKAALRTAADLAASFIIMSDCSEQSGDAGYLFHGVSSLFTNGNQKYGSSPGDPYERSLPGYCS